MNLLFPGASIDLQCLLNHFSQHLTSIVHFPTAKDFWEKADDFWIDFKIGCDGSSGHPVFMRKEPHESLTEVTDDPSGKTNQNFVDVLVQREAYLLNR